MSVVCGYVTIIFTKDDDDDVDIDNINVNDYGGDNAANWSEANIPIIIARKPTAGARFLGP